MQHVKGTTTHQDSDGDDMECEDTIENTNAGNPHVADGVYGVTGRKKGRVRLQGVSSNKRIAQLLTSPWRRQVQKGVEYVADDKTPRYQDMAKGTAGGGKPPKLKIDR
ncbi:unnamed protein product [Arabidopsis lyrata]|uniref:Predicted protein n=1 Tax=Arabidopsis lyrata subsp. lyrata TaxID=81972 RepID=D7ML11_ARALL|nr:predicted protein [Arabidopsis lyrata subsp. lyrata]CAH8278812.1 unnamed protein product [Arabidopsis lyrata]